MGASSSNPESSPSAREIVFEAGQTRRARIREQHLRGAARSGDTAMVNRLLPNDAWALNVENQRGETPLALAAMNGHAEVIDILLNHALHQPISPDLEFPPPQFNKTPHDTLLYHTVNHRSSQKGFTALMLAADMGHTEEVKHLLAFGADVNMRSKNNGVTALMMASRSNHVGVVNALLRQEGVDANIATIDEGYTALMMACHQGAADVVCRLLLHRGIDVQMRSKPVALNSPHALKTALRWTALEIAESMGWADVLKCFRLVRGQAWMDHQGLARLSRALHDERKALEQANPNGRVHADQVLDEAALAATLAQWRAVPGVGRTTLDRLAPRALRIADLPSGGDA